MPAQFAFVDATTCTGPTPNRTFAWDDRDEQAAVADDTVAPTNADVDLTIGKGQGVAGNPEFRLAGRVRVAARGDDRDAHRVQHPTLPPAASRRRFPVLQPTAGPDRGRVARQRGGDAARRDRHALARDRIRARPAGHDERRCDARCDWAVSRKPICGSATTRGDRTSATTPSARSVRSDSSRQTCSPSDTTGLPALSLNDGPIVAYTSHDVGGNLVLNPEKRFRFAVRMPGVRHVHIGPPVLNTLSERVGGVRPRRAGALRTRALRRRQPPHRPRSRTSQVIVKGSKLGLNGTLDAGTRARRSPTPRPTRSRSTSGISCSARRPCSTRRSPTEATPRTRSCSSTGAGSSGTRHRGCRRRRRSSTTRRRPLARTNASTTRRAARRGCGSVSS